MARVPIWRQDNDVRFQGCYHTNIHTYMFAVVNFGALTLVSDFRIERRQVVFLCWMQDSKLGSLRHQIADRLNAHSQTDWAIEDQAKTWTQQPVPMMSEHSAHLTSLPIGFRTWLYQYTCLFLLILMSGTGKRFSNRKETRCLPLLNAGSEAGCWTS